MIWNIPSIEHILSACLNYSLNSSLKKCAHTHMHTHTSTREYVSTPIMVCVFIHRNAWEDEQTNIFAAMWNGLQFVMFGNNTNLNFTHRLCPALPFPLNRTCCVCVCICAYVQVCLGLARQQSSLRLHTHRKAQSNNKGLSKEPSAG